ncbi:uncharacterized protein T551_03345 [Pneumocystis jirovecii RU7]|uniref:DUF3752 domain-containing protein n=1 Tax=Pneumocystis jirovecii (strain RU7) TaxID=1408657 RepID=A0A0W4ZEU0_PNEJ7|nr:uncharacterized protein T551_03345 [Pneumocystis jirovecii RU7]KTW26883.1 hypothetical protein T551_03345 [Pneumocystis jirovecii RU7]
MIGPASPPKTYKKHKNSTIDSSLFTNDKLSYCVTGPSFSEFSEEKKENNIQNREIENSNEMPNKSKRLIGPVLDFKETENDDNEIGPHLSDFTDSVSYEEKKQKKAAEFEEIEKKRLNQISEIPIISQEKKRDDWMIIPPSRSDLNSRIGISLKSRTFNTEKSARLNDFGVQDINLWTESYEDKQKRLKQEAMGIKKPMHQDAKSKKDLNTIFNTEKQKLNHGAKRPSLYDMHLKVSKESTDDPSKRMFDYEKDIGENSLTFSKKLKIINLSKDMSRFSSGSYL